MIVGWGLCRGDSLRTWVYIAPHSGVTPAPSNRFGVSFWVCFPGASFLWGLLFICGVIPHLPPLPLNHPDDVPCGQLKWQLALERSWESSASRRHTGWGMLRR